MLLIVTTLLPVFALMFIGLLAERLRLVPAGGAATLNQFVFNLGLPALIFASVATRHPADLARIGFMGGTAAGMLACFLLLYVFSSGGFRGRHRESGMLSLLASCPNTIFLGLPILIALFPGNDDAVLASTLSNVLSLPLVFLVIFGLEWSRGNGNAPRIVLLKKVGRAMIVNPVLLSTLAGMIFCLAEIPVPESAFALCRALGGTSTPCALVALGMVLASQLAAGGGERSGLLRRISVNTVKLILQPVITWACLALLHVDKTWLAMGVLLAAMPTGTIAYVLSENYAVCTRDSSRAIIANTAASLLTIPLIILALREFCG